MCMHIIQVVTSKHNPQHMRRRVTVVVLCVCACKSVTMLAAVCMFCSGDIVSFACQDDRRLSSLSTRNTPGQWFLI